MEALLYKGVYPFFDPQYAWVRINRNPYGTTGLGESRSFIFVDADIAEELKLNKIELMWANCTPHVRNVRIQSVDGVPASDILANGDSYKTLTEMVCGKRSRSRGPKHSFHANDWTRSAFDPNVYDPITQKSTLDGSVDDSSHKAEELLPEPKINPTPFAAIMVVIVLTILWMIT